MYVVLSSSQGGEAASANIPETQLAYSTVGPLGAFSHYQGPHGIRLY